MVQLAKKDITTPEVLDWQGIHLLHFSGSTCSKKIRIFLDYKNVDWVSHPVNLLKRENNSDWFMGINPRGLVPVLVHDGAVHIESNDILDYLEALYPEPALMPAEHTQTLANLLKTEDDLHVDLRNLTMRYTAPSKLMQRSREQLAQYANAGSGTVNGQVDEHKAEELAYWRQFAENGGITDAQVRESGGRFKAALGELDYLLQAQPYLMGDEVSLADIAWIVNINRIVLAGYPLQQLHPQLWRWRQRLLKLPAFAKEAVAPPPQLAIAWLIRAKDLLLGKTLGDLMGEP
ncbi:MAG: glutathione S-transferase family protein [Pseudomonadota bacterium]